MEVIIHIQLHSHHQQIYSFYLFKTQHLLLSFIGQKLMISNKTSFSFKNTFKGEFSNISTQLNNVLIPFSRTHLKIPLLHFKNQTLNQTSNSQITILYKEHITKLRIIQRG